MEGVSEIRSKQPNQNLIEYAEKLLRDAKSGELQSIAGVVVFSEGTTSEIWISAPAGYPLHLHSDRMLGCLERLKFTLMAHRSGLDAEDTWEEI